MKVPKFLDDVNKLLSKTPKRTQANYVMGQIVLASTDEMGEKVQDIVREFNSMLSGTSKEEQRWVECLNDMSDSLSLATGALYVRNYFDESAKQSAAEIIENLRLSFKNILKNVKSILLLFLCNFWTLL